MKNPRAGVWIRIAAASALALLILPLGGCGVYRLGSTLPPNVKTICLPTFINKCGEPQVENETTQAAIQEFQKDGTLRVVQAPGDADLVMDVTLSQYKLEPLRYEKDQPKTTKEYRLRIVADIVVRKAKVQEPLVKRSVAGEATFIVVGDLTTSKHSALPAAARDLAHRIVESVTEAW